MRCRICLYILSKHAMGVSGRCSLSRSSWDDRCRRIRLRVCVAVCQYLLPFVVIYWDQPSTVSLGTTVAVTNVLGPMVLRWSWAPTDLAHPFGGEFHPLRVRAVTNPLGLMVLRRLQASLVVAHPFGRVLNPPGLMGLRRPWAPLVPRVT